tara:strand:+ start:364 stop:894 length:531 start_codon:yes stop_codon:yes gene_type:complete
MAVDAKTGQPIYHGAPSVGLRNVGSYQVSGQPWVSGSGDGNGTAQAARTIKRFQFPFVTREVTVRALPGNPNSVNTLKTDDNRFISGSYVWVSFASGTAHVFTDVSDVVTYNKASDIIVGNHYVSVTGSFNIKAKLKEIYVIVPDANAATTYQIVADLTNVPTKRMYHLTGSGLTE